MVLWLWPQLVVYINLSPWPIVLAHPIEKGGKYFHVRMIVHGGVSIHLNQDSVFILLQAVAFTSPHFGIWK